LAKPCSHGGKPGGHKMNHGMALIPHTSVTAQPHIVAKTRLRSQPLPCFSKIQNETRPFFIQWHITALDIKRIRSISYGESRQEMQEVRSYYGKSKRDGVTIEEYCAFSGIKKGLVRMHVMSRKMENDIFKTISNQPRLLVEQHL
jgi:hypothetical protein